MYDILKDQFKSGKVLAASKHYNIIRREKTPAYFNDIYPLAQDYFHELNPFFIGKLYHPDFFKFSDVLTVRDGYIAFAHFLVTHLAVLPKLGPKLFLIHPDLARLIPANLTSYFATWKIVHNKGKRILPSKAKKVIVFGFASEDYLGNLDSLKERLLPLKEIASDATIKIFTPIRKEAFELKGKETTYIHHLVSDIKDLLPGRKIEFLTSEQFFDITDFKDTYFIDIAYDNFLVTDNYLHYYVLSRGATVNKIDDVVPNDSFFDLALSFNHELHISPLPKVECLLTEVLFYTKTSSNKDFLIDPGFHRFMRELLK